MIWLLACGGAPSVVTDTAAAAEHAACSQTDNTQVWVMTELRASRLTDGASWGFDLDDHVTDAGDDDGCYVGDYTSPEGVEGIDNAFAAVLPVLDTTEAAALDSVINEQVTSGELLLMVELEDYDGPDDSCVNLSFLRGEGDPAIGNDGAIESGQTFDRDLDRGWSRVDGLAFDDGSLEAGPIEINLPVNVLDASLDFHALDGRIRLDVADDGSASGFFAGGVSVAYILEVVETTGIAQEVYDVAAPVLQTLADLRDEHGECGLISMTFEYEATPAFFYAD